MNNEQYETNERALLARQLSRSEAQPLADRKIAQNDALELMRDPHIVARNLDFINNGDYGFGAQARYRDILTNKRCNREAQVIQLLAGLDCQCPQAECIKAWKMLSTGKDSEQAVLSQLINDTFAEHIAALRGGEAVPLESTVMHED